MNNSLICTLLLSPLALVAAAADGGAPVPPAERPKSPAELATVPKRYVCKDGDTFLYRWMEPAQPEPGKSYPLVVMMHGSGECGTNNLDQLKLGVTPIVNWGKARRQEFYLIAGQCPQGDMWTALRTVSGSQPMTPKPTKAMAHQLELVESVLSGELPIDRDRVYVTGISMGGYGTWDLISRRPGMFAAAMPVCGGGDLAQVPKLAHMPIFIHHGDADSNVAVWNARAMYAALILSGSNCARYSEYPDCGHPSWNPAYGDVRNIDWLFAQRRPPAPAWQTPLVETLPNGALRIVPPGPRYEIEFMVSCAGQGQTRVVGRRSGRFPIVTVGGRVAEGTVFGFDLGEGQVVIANPAGGRKFDFADIRIRTLAKEEK